MSSRKGWSPLHHLAYIYAAIASVDGSVSNTELEVLCDKLRQWKPELDDRALMPIVVTAVAALGSDVDASDIDQVHDSVKVVARTLDAEQRGAILDDLISIAGADGLFLPGEGDVLLMIRDALEEHADGSPRRRLPDAGDRAVEGPDPRTGPA